MNDQPEALRVADETQRCFPKSGKKAARLLREQHAEIERLRWLLNGGGLCSKPLDADIAAIVHKHLDSLYVEDPPAIDAAMEGKP